MENQIPKILHYCWFGGKEKPEIVKKCIETWKKYCPDFVIYEWNENNFNIKCCNYVKESYELKKWAFVSDYARHFILNDKGGVYLDTDVELIKSLDDLLTLEAFCGFESDTMINSGLIFGCKKNNWLCEEMLESYSKDSFLIDGELNLRTVCDRATSLLVTKGLKLNNSLQVIDGISIFPKEYFNPKNIKNGKLEISEKTYSIHHFMASWETFSHRFKNSNINGKVILILSKIFGEKFKNKILGLKYKNK